MAVDSSQESENSGPHTEGDLLETCTKCKNKAVDDLDRYYLRTVGMCYICHVLGRDQEEDS